MSNLHGEFLSFHKISQAWPGVPEDRKEKQHRDEIAKLKAALADRTLENDFFRSALLKVKEGRQPSTEAGASASTTSSGRGRKSKAR